MSKRGLSSIETHEKLVWRFRVREISYNIMHVPVFIRRIVIDFVCLYAINCLLYIVIIILVGITK